MLGGNRTLDSDSEFVSVSSPVRVFTSIRVLTAWRCADYISDPFPPVLLHCTALHCALLY
jgi:hypothetical protein